MSKINRTYANGIQNAIAATSPGQPTGCPDGSRLPAPQPCDRTTLSEAGLAAAARFSNLIPRTADVYAPALPAPGPVVETAPRTVNATIPETPSSRNQVRNLYSKQQFQNTGQDSLPGARIDILA